MSKLKFRSIGCHCNACRRDGPHLSCCAVHNAPAMKPGPCNCRNHKLELRMFDSPHDQFAHRNGQRCWVREKIVKPTADIDEEVLPMYVITFDDNETIHAWPEELHRTLKGRDK